MKSFSGTAVRLAEPYEGIIKFALRFTRGVVNLQVPTGTIGAYLLVEHDEEGVRPLHVGRSDTCLRRRLSRLLFADVRPTSLSHLPVTRIRPTAASPTGTTGTDRWAARTPTRFTPQVRQESADDARSSPKPLSFER